MFDSLAQAATSARGAGAVGAWARVENAACARRLFASADELERMYAADGSDERVHWCLDNWDAVAASVAAAQNVSLGVASHQLLIADGLRERLPRVAEVFAAGAINYRMVAAVVSRTRLIKDPEAMAKVDTEIAAHMVGWGSLSVEKTQNEIDHWVHRYDPAAVRRTEESARDRYADVRKPQDGSGTADIEARLLATDADALGAIGHGLDRLTCLCGKPDCDATDAQPSTVVVHVIAHEESLSDDTPVQLDGHVPDQPWGSQPLPPVGPAATPPATLMSGGMLPAPLLAAKIAGTAKIVPIVHPGNQPPQPRYIPTAVLATFIRCRDMTCRFPGCDEPTHRCDLDHTIAYPAGPTQASNLKCLCRKHHLLKTFWGWHDQQWPDGTVVWTSPDGQRYTTHPGSRILFPTLCKPTAPIVRPRDVPVDDPARTLAMPRRTQTRTQNRNQAINDERQHNEHALQAEAEERARNREQHEDPGNTCGEPYFPSRPRPPGDDPPPF